MVPDGENDQQHQQDGQQMDVQPGLLSDLNVGQKNGHQLGQGNALEQRNDREVDIGKIVRDEGGFIGHG